MKDEKWIKEQLTPELLERIAGGMPDENDANFKLFLGLLKGVKATGTTKERVIETITEKDYPIAYRSWDTSEEEMIAFIDRIWDSL